VKRLSKSIKAHRRFNRRDPRKLISVTIDSKTPLIRIGEVPEIIYASKKEGSKNIYRHKTKQPHPVLYAHPRGKYFLIIGGKVRIGKWLYD